MKKLLNILSVITLISITSSNVFACDDWEDLITEKIDLNEIIKVKSLGKIIFSSTIPTKMEILKNIKDNNLTATALTENDFNFENNPTATRVVIIGINDYQGKVTLTYEKKIDQQATIYIDKNGEKVTTSERDLSKIDSKEVIQIGFFQNKEEIQAVRMPKTIEKVPVQLPSAITSLQDMFCDAKKFNQDLSTWDTSKITNMDSVFYNALLFNQDLSTWNTSKVTSMRWMFYNAVSFNQNISQWDTANVINMGYMFYNASRFNQDLSQWDTANVLQMERMFWQTNLFNQDISKWNVSKVINMSWMFYHASLFNQDISKWNVSKVTDMRNMFDQAFSFNQDLSQWNVNNVTVHNDFSSKSGIDNSNKLPKFKN